MYRIKKLDIIEVLALFGVAFLLLIYSGFLLSYFQHKKEYQPFKELNPQTLPGFLKPIYSESLVVLEQDSGKIIFSKNPQILFPPASLTKLITLFMIYEKIHQGLISEDTVVPISIRAWAKTLPEDATRMFLEPGQIVSMYELMLGLAIPSGNDAAIAVAEYLSGSVAKFVKDMNRTISNLGLHHMHFEDANGYSPNNYITAQEFALFCREYLNHFPESLQEIHSVEMLQFPQDKNYPKGYPGQHHIITQLNHNPLLGRLEGADGLKTGYIGKSGFNVAVSVKRQGIRLIVVDLGSFAGTAKAANENRVQDIIKVVNYLYSTYQMYPIPATYLLQRLGVKSKANITHSEIYHYSPIISVSPHYYPLGSSVSEGQTVGTLIIKDKLGEVALYPLIAEKFIPPHSISDLLWREFLRFVR